MYEQFDRNKERLRRKESIRRKIHGTAERPRLAVFRSLKHISAQIINDDKGETIVAISTVSKEFSNFTKNVEAAKKIGEIIAKKAIEAGIKKIVFDRSGYIYHGRIKALAEEARKAGLEF